MSELPLYLSFGLKFCTQRQNNSLKWQQFLPETTKNKRRSNPWDPGIAAVAIFLLAPLLWASVTRRFASRVSDFLFMLLPKFNLAFSLGKTVWILTVFVCECGAVLWGRDILSLLFSSSFPPRLRVDGFIDCGTALAAIWAKGIIN